MPAEQDGRYVLLNHGIVSELTREQFVQLSAGQVRETAVFWMLFSLVGATYFTFARRALLTSVSTAAGRLETSTQDET